MFLTQPVEILSNAKGEVDGLKCIRMDLGKPDASGRRSPVPVPDSEFVVPCDMVIKAIGQNKPTGVLAMLAPFGVEQVKGYLKVDEGNRTSHEKIFAGGDCVRSHGEASTVMAVQDGKIAAASIAKQLLGAAKPLAEAVSKR